MYLPVFFMCIYLFFYLVLAISGQSIFYDTDWRFNEFPNASSHAMYACCMELLSLPLTPKVVANNLIDVAYTGSVQIPIEDLPRYINAIGILLAQLPESYWSVIYDRLQSCLNHPKMLCWSYRWNPFEMFNFKLMQSFRCDPTYVNILAVTHSTFQHMGCYKLATLAR